MATDATSTGYPECWARPTARALRRPSGGTGELDTATRRRRPPVQLAILLLAIVVGMILAGFYVVPAAALFHHLLRNVLA